MEEQGYTGRLSSDLIGIAMDSYLKMSGVSTGMLEWVILNPIFPQNVQLAEYFHEAAGIAASTIQ